MPHPNRYVQELEEKGELRGLSQALMTALTLRFGEGAERMRPQVEAVPADDFEQMMQRVLTATSLEAVFAED